MALFKNTTYTVGALVERIENGVIALPDLQRPFVWDATKVRDLFDSLYRGFPVGSLHLWETGADAQTRDIGTNSKQSAPRLLIVDGQQRLTSLYAVITGRPVLTDDFEEVQLRIAFRPSDGVFRVCDAAVERDVEFIPDIATVWQLRPHRAVREFLSRLTERYDIDDDEQDRLAESIDKLYGVQGYTFHAVELSSAADDEAVSDIFVRINSKGTPLNQSDFILTLMTVFWQEGRRELEEFARQSRQPSTRSASSFNWHLQPKAPQLLRVTIALAFRRAVLKAVYSLLRGHDFRGGMIDSAQREEQFERLRTAQSHVLDVANWHEFFTSLERAGFRSNRLISSQNTVVYCYALWLIGRIDYGVPVDQLREAIARWFFMAQITGRYTGSFESQVESDLALLDNRGARDGFLDRMNKVIEDTLTQDFWVITLPNDLSTSASGSPALYSYLAALNILDADVLLSTTKVRAQMDPSVLAYRTVERHRLFPRVYLQRELGLKTTKQINQIANMALVEWSDDVAIDDRPPVEYWPEQVQAKDLPASRLTKQQYLHALPDGWECLDYEEFLAQRRMLMARVVRDAFRKLGETSYQPAYEPPARTYVEQPDSIDVSLGISLSALLAEELISEGMRLSSADADVAATVLSDGSILMDGEVYQSLATATVSAGSTESSQEFWLIETEDGMIPLRRIFAAYKRRDAT